jgi:hypothetical protein
MSGDLNREEYRRQIGTGGALVPMDIITHGRRRFTVLAEEPAVMGQPVAAVPDAPTTVGAGSFFFKNDGNGKSQFCVRFPSPLVAEPVVDTNIHPEQTAVFPEAAESVVRVLCPVCDTSYALHRLGLVPGTEPLAATVQCSVCKQVFEALVSPKMVVPNLFQKYVLRRKPTLTHVSSTQVR